METRSDSVSGHALLVERIFSLIFISNTMYSNLENEWPWWCNCLKTRGTEYDSRCE